MYGRYNYFQVYMIRLSIQITIDESRNYVQSIILSNGQGGENISEKRWLLKPGGTLFLCFR